MAVAVAERLAQWEQAAQAVAVQVKQTVLQIQAVAVVAQAAVVLATVARV